MFPLSFLRVHVSVYIKFDKERHQAVNRKPVVNNKQYVSGFDNIKTNERKQVQIMRRMIPLREIAKQWYLFWLPKSECKDRQKEREREREQRVKKKHIQ